MAERQSQKIGITVFLTVALLAGPAQAKDNFVNYKEARAVLDQKGPASKDPGTILPEEVRDEAARGGALLIFDARTKDEYDRERLPGSKLPRDEAYYRDAELFKQKIMREAPDSKNALERATKNIPRNTPIVTYCHAHCGLSKALKLDLEGLGFTNVRWMDGGIDVWREKSYPVEKNE